MASPKDFGGDLFDPKSRKINPKAQEQLEKTIEEHNHAYMRQKLQELDGLINNNATLPVTISSIQLTGGAKTRRSFLDRIFHPLLSVNRDGPYTFIEALREVGLAANKLRRFGIFHDDISITVAKPDPTDPSSTVSDIDIYLKAREQGRLSFRSGTDVGELEGSAYTNLSLRNIFGGAESLTINAAFGTRTTSSYSATFNTPLFSDPDYQVSIDALVSSTSKPWASHDEGLKGGGAKFTWMTKGAHMHEFGYTGVWRQITSLAVNASPTIRHDAGDSIKSSVSHIWTKESRDHPFIPQRGYMLKTISEIAGWGPLQGDVAFWKSEVHTAGALPIPIPGIKGDSGVSLTGSFRGGILYPLAQGFGSTIKPSRTNDRFQLGCADVRGFKLSGLGPRDGDDAVGGDVYTSGGLNLLFPLPRTGKDSPLRFQVFANAGRLLALKNYDSGDEKGNEDTSITQSMYSTIGELGNGLPSTAVGFGLVYGHPIARFELNFCLPLVLRRGEEGRKGFQIGMGINLL